MKAGIDRVLITKIVEPKTEKKDLTFLEKEVQVEKGVILDVSDSNELSVEKGDTVYFLKGTDLKISSEIYAIKLDSILCYEYEEKK